MSTANIPDKSLSNKRIAKNTLFLYFRMMLLMVIGLYTSRKTLQLLGVDDYGIFNVVAGVVAMFSIFSSSLTSAISRYITFEIGKGRKERLSEIFATSVNVLIILAISIALLMEIVGVWFLNNKLNIPVGRMTAANWAMHCSIVSFCIALISIPYQACIVAHERMGIYAYMSILEAVLKLLIVFALYLSPLDRLIFYSILLVVVSLLMRIIYGIYSKHSFEEAVYRLYYNKPLIKEMLSFSGWTIFGTAAYQLNTQGIAILINIFFGVAVNAARGLAITIEGVVHQFIGNFTMAMNPQIIKSYASGNIDYMHALICRSAKFSYFLMLIISLPILFETNIILNIWLDRVPKYTLVFTRLTLITSMLLVFVNPLVCAVQSTGKIKQYQIVVGLTSMLTFPISYFAYRLGYPPESTYYIYLVLSVFLLFIRLYIVSGLVSLSITSFMSNVMMPCMVVSIVSLIIPILIFLLMSEGFSRLLIMCVCCFAFSLVAVFLFGLNKAEKKWIINIVQLQLKRISIW